MKKMLYNQLIILLNKIFLVLMPIESVSIFGFIFKIFISFFNNFHFFYFTIILNNLLNIKRSSFWSCIFINYKRVRRTIFNTWYSRSVNVIFLFLYQDISYNLLKFLFLIQWFIVWKYMIYIWCLQILVLSCYHF